MAPATQIFVAATLLGLLSTVVSLDNGLGLKPAMGWNTWCTLGRCGRDYCSAKEIMSIADAMATNGMKEAGFEYINMDDCWADVRDSDGTIVPDKSRFPDGLVPVIDYVKSKGFKFGVYTDAGLYTCSKGGRSHSIPGSYGHYEQDANTYAKWGVEYVKMDWCSTKVNGTNLDPKVQYPQMSKALNATGKPIFFNSCEWGVDQPWLWMSQYANSWRTGPDHHDEWSSTAVIIEINADKGKYAGPGGWNDADFIYTGGQGCSDDRPLEHCPGQTDTEYKTEFIMWCMMGSSLIVATDIRNMTDIMQKTLLNIEVISINQDYPGKGGQRITNAKCQNDTSATCQVWAKHLSDSSYAVAFYNSGSKMENIWFSFANLGITGSVLLHDLWAQKDVGHFSGNVTITGIEPHGVEVYKVTPV